MRDFFDITCYAYDTIEHFSQIFRFWSILCYCRHFFCSLFSLLIRELISLFLMWPQSYVESLNKLWNPVGKPITRYFSLGDLWYSFEKWSACGVGTRVESHDSKDVVHYFVPKLSVIQLYTIKSVEKLRYIKT